jgi:hypothetical protein
MDIVEEHPHSFLPGSWPFADLTTTAAFTSAHVLSGHPILLVFHDHDGDWQLLSGEDDSEGKIICLGCAYDRDNAIGILSDLPAGWMAFRDSVGQAWQCEPYEDSDADEG